MNEVRRTISQAIKPRLYDLLYEGSSKLHIRERRRNNK